MFTKPISRKLAFLAGTAATFGMLGTGTVVAVTTASAPLANTTASHSLPGAIHLPGMAERARDGSQFAKLLTATCAVPDWSPSMQLDPTGTILQFGLMGISTTCEPTTPMKISLQNFLFIDPNDDGSNYVEVAVSPGQSATLPPAQSFEDIGNTSYTELLDEYGDSAGVITEAEWTFQRTDGTTWGVLPLEPECSGTGTATLTCFTFSPEDLLG